MTKLWKKVHRLIISWHCSSEWCSMNKLALNTSKTKETDYRRHTVDPAPLYINGDRVQRVSSFNFLGTHIPEDLSWSTNMTAVKKTQQLLRMLVAFYHSMMESVLVYCITVYMLAVQRQTGDVCRGSSKPFKKKKNTLCPP